MTRKSGTATDQRLAFEREALPYLDALHTAALRLARNTDEASDLTQETILRAYRCFHQFTPGSNCRAWLLTILYNNFRSSYRRGAREHPCASAEEFADEIDARSFAADQSRINPEELLSHRRAGRRIELALAALPAEFREALILVDVQELNYQEVADVLDVPLGTVKSRVSRGRALMRRALCGFDRARGKTGT